MTMRRTDAVQNRERLLDAAEAVFRDHGMAASLELIHRQAGLGRATQFRNFPDRQSLLVALLERALDRLEAKAGTLGDDPGALVRLLRFGADHARLRGPTFGYWQAIDQTRPEFAAATARYVSIFAEPIRRAIAAGMCRGDLVPEDILLLSALLSPRSPRPAADSGDGAGRGWTLLLAATGLRDAI